MKVVTQFLLGLYFLTLWTYGIPALRLPDGLGALPYGVALLCLTWIALLCSWTNKIWGISRNDRWILYATGCYVLGSLISVVVASHVDYLLVFKICAFPTLIVLVMAVERTLSDLRKVLIILAIGGGILASYGLYGFVTGATGDPAEHALIYFGISYMPSSRNSDVLYVIVPFWCLVGALSTGYGIGRSRARRVIAWALLTAVGTALMLTYARGIWITIPLTFLLGGVFLRQWSAKIGVIIGAGIVGVVLFAASGSTVGFLVRNGVPVDRLVERMNTITTLTSRFGSNSNDNRLQLIRSSLSVGAEHSPFGIGVGQLRYVLDDLTGLAVNHAENMYVQVFAEQGWLGFAGLLGICAIAIGPRFEAFRDAETGFVRGTCRLLAVNLAMYGTVNLLIDGLWYWSVLAVCVAANLRCTKASDAT